MIVPPRISTKRFILRRHTAADLDAFSAFLTHPTATRYMAFEPEQRTPAGARAMLEYVFSAYDSAEPDYSLTIADPATDAYLASCRGQPLADASGFEIYYTVDGPVERDATPGELPHAAMQGQRYVLRRPLT
jgi:RimJ/RimL family protein N-acetyltransferase